MLQDAIKHFREKGFVTIPKVLVDFEVEFYRELLKDAIKERKQSDKRLLSEKSLYEQSFIQCQNLWEDYPKIRELAFNQKITKLAADLLGADALRIWHDQALVKEKGGRKTDIHHDQPYWPIKEHATITAWIPFDKITSTNGQLGFYPGSHKIPNKNFIDIFSGKVSEDDTNEILAIKNIEPEYQLLNAGDISFHHGLTFHEAKPNLSNKDRLVYTVIFFADGSTRDSDRFHFSVDRPGIKPGQVIASDVTPLAYPLEEIPSAPKTPIQESFNFLQKSGLLPKT
jgi:ectoine hydroxylase-related dioxygenase (phytanoyl-CoA dioxygenase family)